MLARREQRQNQWQPHCDSARQPCAPVAPLRPGLDTTARTTQVHGSRLVHLRRLEQRHGPDAAPPQAARESEFEIWSGDPDEIVAASRKSWPPDEVKKSGDARKSWPPAKGEGSPPRAEGGASPVNAYWWTRKVLAENEVDLDDDEDLADGKSRVVFTSVGSC